MERMINLLPWRQRRRQACRRFWWQLLVSGAGIGTLTVVAFHILAAQDRQVATLWLQSNAQMLSALAAKLPHFQTQHQLWLNQQAKTQRQQHTRDWQQRLNILAETMPDNAWFTQMHFQRGKLSVSGLARTFHSLTKLEQALDATGGFRLSKAGATERDAQGRWQFHYELEKDDEYVAQP